MYTKDKERLGEERENIMSKLLILQVQKTYLNGKRASIKKKWRKYVVSIKELLIYCV